MHRCPRSSHGVDYNLFHLAPPTTTRATTNNVAPVTMTTPQKICSFV